MVNEQYIAIIGDIYRSKDLKNRETIQKELQATLIEINKKYKSAIASSFSITMGDSIQGLLHANAPFTKILRDIELMMMPVTFKYGIGLGKVTTEINKENSQVNDGPAYHRARRALEIIEEHNQKYTTSKTNIMILTADEEDIVDRLINTIFTLNTAIQDKWTNRQKEIIKTYLENNENQYDTANALNIGQSSISKALKTTNFYAYKTALLSIQDYINTKIKEGVADD